MSSDISKFRIAAALFVAAFMLVVPLAVTFDSDAEIAEDSAGYYSEGNEKATDDEMKKADLNTKHDAVAVNMFVLMSFLDLMHTEADTIDADTFSEYESRGVKIEDAKETQLYSSGMDAGGIKVVLRYTAAGDLVKLNSETLAETEGLDKAGEAISNYLGPTVAVGDKLIVTGKLNSDSAEQTVTEYAYVDDTKLVPTKITETDYSKGSLSFNIELVKAGDETGKSISMDLSTSQKGVTTTTFTYAKEIGQLTPGDECDMKTHVDNDVSAKMTFGVDGKDYDVTEKKVDIPDEDDKETVTFRMVADMTVPNSLKTKIDGLAGSDNVTVKKTYADAESAYNDVKQKVDGKKTNYLPFIIGGVVAVVIIAGVAFFLIKRKQ